MNRNQILSLIDGISYYKILYTTRVRKLNFQYEDIEIHLNYTTLLEKRKEFLFNINWIFIIKNNEAIKMISFDTIEEWSKNMNIYNCTEQVYNNMYLMDIREIIIESLKREGVYAE